jgi:hypothetical protein
MFYHLSFLFCFARFVEFEVTFLLGTAAITTTTTTTTEDGLFYPNERLQISIMTLMYNNDIILCEISY